MEKRYAHSDHYRPAAAAGGRPRLPSVAWTRPAAAVAARSAWAARWPRGGRGGVGETVGTRTGSARTVLTGAAAGAAATRPVAAGGAVGATGTAGAAVALLTGRAMGGEVALRVGPLPRGGGAA